MILALLESMRPKQWIKNLILFAPLAFAQKLLDLPLGLRAALAFAAFCLASSGVYLVNDILDREADQHHPEKKDRPIASGRVSVSAAAAFAVILFAGALAIAAFVRLELLLIVGAYIALNLAYSTVLKRMVIIDAFCIAFGFVLRIFAGAKALGEPGHEIEISTWILLCTLLGSLFLAFCKRRHELGLEENASSHRAILAEYSTRFLDQMISITTACTVMAYALWTISDATVEKFHTNKLFWTVPFVCYGIFRYLYLVHQKNQGGSPSKIFLSDKPLIANIVLWMAAVVAILYF
jgi:4-hydroxybenzoate polyprenyltransferase